MKKAIKILEVIALVSVIVFSMTSCDFFEENIPSIIGTWERESEQVTFREDSIFTYFMSGLGNVRGTFTYDNKNIQLTMTHKYSGGNWIESNPSGYPPPDSGGSLAIGQLWNTFDGRSRTYEIKQWKSGSNKGKYYLNISIMSIWGRNITKQ